jgi:hypothetical protein
MRDYETSAPGHSTSKPSSSRNVITDPSIAKNNVYPENDGTGSNRDNSRLADLGYRPELKRDFSALETFGVAFSIMCVTIAYSSPADVVIGVLSLPLRLPSSTIYPMEDQFL